MKYPDVLNKLVLLPLSMPAALLVSGQTRPIIYECVGRSCAENFNRGASGFDVPTSGPFNATAVTNLGAVQRSNASDHSSFRLHLQAFGGDGADRSLVKVCAVVSLLGSVVISKIQDAPTIRKAGEVLCTRINLNNP